MSEPKPVVLHVDMAKVTLVFGLEGKTCLSSCG